MAAFYSNSVHAFLADNNEAVLGILTQKSSISGFHQLLHKQTSSWYKEIELLKSALRILNEKGLLSSNSGILLEYPIARRSKRIDSVLIVGALIIVLEFKIESSVYQRQDEEQLLDYCLDLRDFHFKSRNKRIVPVLAATEASDYLNTPSLREELVQDIVYANGANLSQVLEAIIVQFDSDDCIDFKEWNDSKYAPTPTIIEAAQTLFRGNSVEEITRYHADSMNLTLTTNAVVEAINKAKENREKIICFITGVPGAGKTLAGLNIAHHNDFQTSEESLATFLSGNGPLIKVLREALSRDAKKLDPSTRKKENERIIAFIENVHRFIEAYFVDKNNNFVDREKKPNNHIVIFDEAQRAWNANHSKRKFNRDFSEAEMMLDIMDRHDDWAVIVALIGGGQEINTGEAGLREWGNNILRKFNHWKVYISPELKLGNHSTGNLSLFDEDPIGSLDVIEHKDLHLSVSIRSYKAEKLSEWVSLVLSNQSSLAKDIFLRDLGDYPIFITRSLAKAKRWLRDRCKASRRMGLVASSGGRRLRADGLDVKAELEEEHWFLNDRNDVRSSYSLELPATEFGVQGLELDWVGVCWDADLRRESNSWSVKAFKGTKWQSVNQIEAHTYTINKYRVLLTRAREGMIIWIPEGDLSDKTRLPEFYNSIYEYLRSCGIPTI